MLYSEVSQKNKYYILLNIYGIYKNGTDADIENRLVDTRPQDLWTERVGRIERVALKHTSRTMCKMDSQWEFAVWHRELNLVPCDNLEGWDGMGGGREVQKRGDICIPRVDAF